MTNGYTGKIADIDLTTRAITAYPMSDRDRALFLGGKTLAAKILYDTLGDKVEALSEENIIVITTSPLTGSTSPCSSRFNISSISPLTGLLISSNCGGNFGLHLKRAGYDGLILRGKSSERVFLDVDNETILIKNADHLWGKRTSEAQELIGEKKRGKLVIGIAGEHLVRYAGVFSEERAAGRGGIGAVFGYKNLKGIVASGSNSIELFNQEGFKTHNQAWIKQLRSHYLTGERLPLYGTAGLVRSMQSHNLLATRNYSSGTYDEYEKISGETLRSEYLEKNSGCVTCPIQCARVVSVYGKSVKGPELETIGLLGSNLLNSDLPNISNVNHLCDEYGLDTMSFGGSIGLAMELNEKGLWNNGLVFGDNSKLEALVKLVATRDGIGDDLAEGTRRIAAKYGGVEYAINVKGLEIAAYEPRAAQGMGLGYATSNRGGCHLNGGYMVVMEGLGLDVSGKTTRSKAAYTVFFQDMMEAVSAGGTCLFTTYALLPDRLVRNLNSKMTALVSRGATWFGGVVAWFHNHPSWMSFNLKGVLPSPYSIQMVTGRKTTIGSFLETGERGYNLERLINLRQGLTAADDTLPKRLTAELQRADDPDSKVKLDQMLGAYYKIRGWDRQGVPTKKRLQRLGLE